MDGNGQFPVQGNTTGQPSQPVNTQGIPAAQPFVSQTNGGEIPVEQAPLGGNVTQDANSVAPTSIPNVQQSPFEPSVYVANQPAQTIPQNNPAQPSQPVLQGSFIPQAPVTDEISQPLQPAADATADSPRFSLEDLYGSSHNTQNQTIPQVQSVVPTTAEQPEAAPERYREPTPPDSIQGQEMQTPREETPVVASVLADEKTSESPTGIPAKEPIDSGGGGFRIPPLLIRVVGGLVLALIAVILLSGVASLFKGSSTNKDVTLTYWGLWEDSNVFQGIINDFHRQNPTITVNYVKQDPEKYTDRLLTRMQNGTGPDIFRLHNSWVTPLQSALLPLPSSVIDQNQLKQNYFPVMNKDLVINGAVYGVPLEMDNLVLYTNKDIFDHAGVKVPTTWEDFVTVSKGLTVKDGDGHIKTAGAAIGTYENVVHAPDIISLLLLQNGANLNKLQGLQNAIDALTFYTSFAKSDDRVWDTTLDSSLMAFSRGKVGMYFGYLYDYLAIKATAPQLNIEVHPVPHLPGRDMSIASYWVEGVSSKSKHPKEAFLFMKYLAQKDVMAKLYTEEAKTRQYGELYPRIDLANTLSSDPVLATFVNQSSKAVSSFFASDTKFDGFNGGLNRYLGNAINSMLNNTSADSALGTLAQGVAQIFNQYASSSQ